MLASEAYDKIHAEVPWVCRCCSGNCKHFGLFVPNPFPCCDFSIFPCSVSLQTRGRTGPTLLRSQEVGSALREPLAAAGYIWGGCSMGAGPSSCISPILCPAGSLASLTKTKPLKSHFWGQGAATLQPGIRKSPQQARRILSRAPCSSLLC